MTFASTPNPDLVTGRDDKAHWDSPDHRRRGFHNFHTVVRYAMSLRAPRVLPLWKDVDWTIGDFPDVARFLKMPQFSAFVVARGDRILYEAYAPDFGPDRPHPVMSITKTTLNLMLGRCVADGLVDLDRPVKDYLPEIGTGYANATVRATADMDVANDFTEDRYGVIEDSVGFRLPRVGQGEGTLRSFLCDVTSEDVTNRTGKVLYKSTNSDIIGWIVERASGRPLRDWLIELVEAAGLEGCAHVACDRDGVPLMHGGLCLTARDLARYGLLLARRGEGVDGARVGDATFIDETRSLSGIDQAKPLDWMRYSRQTYTNGTWIGHAGYGGQFLLANPDTEMVVVYLSVSENKDASDDYFFDPLIKMMGELTSLPVSTTGAS
jgi:CubicO group peptidase (beta-lactamase class C family)